MKIAVIGYSGSGKSTLARQLGIEYSIPVLHLDSINFLEGWKTREQQEAQAIARSFMDDNPSWIIDGNYTNLEYQRRMEEATLIIFFRFSRFRCLWQALRRFITYRQTTRPDMAAGCQEKLDLEFLIWIVFQGRSKKHRKNHEDIVTRYKDKSVILRNPKDVKRFFPGSNN